MWCPVGQVSFFLLKITLQGTNISHPKALLKMIFLFPRWDMLVSWRVVSLKLTRHSSERTSFLTDPLTRAIYTTIVMQYFFAQLVNIFRQQVNEEAVFFFGGGSVFLFNFHLLFPLLLIFNMFFKLRPLARLWVFRLSSKMWTHLVAIPWPGLC